MLIGSKWQPDWKGFRYHSVVVVNQSHVLYIRSPDPCSISSVTAASQVKNKINFETNDNKYAVLNFNFLEKSDVKDFFKYCEVPTIYIEYFDIFGECHVHVIQSCMSKKKKKNILQACRMCKQLHPDHIGVNIFVIHTLRACHSQSEFRITQYVKVARMHFFCLIALGTLYACQSVAYGAFTRA